MKRLLPFALPSLGYFFLAPLAHAQLPQTVNPINPCNNAGIFASICALGTSSLSVGKVLGAFISLLLILAVIIAVLYLILGGIKWITSHGDKAEVETARNHIMAAVLGLIIVFLAFFIINFVLTFFIPGFSLFNIPLPTL